MDFITILGVIFLVVIVGFVTTVSVATLLYTLPAVLVALQRYL